jgi:hypothetical protein
MVNLRSFFLGTGRDRNPAPRLVSSHSDPNGKTPGAPRDGTLPKNPPERDFGARRAGTQTWRSSAESAVSRPPGLPPPKNSLLLILYHAARFWLAYRHKAPPEVSALAPAAKSSPVVSRRRRGGLQLAGWARSHATRDSLRGTQSKYKKKGWVGSWCAPPRLDSPGIEEHRRDGGGLDADHPSRRGSANSHSRFTGH